MLAESDTWIINDFCSHGLVFVVRRDFINAIANEKMLVVSPVTMMQNDPRGWPLLTSPYLVWDLPRRSLASFRMLSGVYS